ncbi:MAG: hypothetical protein M0Z36_13085 [Thermaerobacter sp.]|nr:hypothetical protein [Thermaerobacter sp.]
MATHPKTSDWSAVIVQHANAPHPDVLQSARVIAIRSIRSGAERKPTGSDGLPGPTPRVVP